MRIKLTSVMVDDQEKALRFYTEMLGFLKKRDIPMGGPRFLTVVSPEAPDEVELLLEPMGHPAAPVYQKALFDAGVPLAAFQVDNIRSEYARMKQLGVTFRHEPRQTGPVTTAVFADTCGNLIQMYQV